MIALKAPLEFTQPKVVIEPAVATMCTSPVVQDKASGVSYMEMVTTSVGWVALTVPAQWFKTPGLP